MSKFDFIGKNGQVRIKSNVLTNREKEVAILIALGNSNKEMGIKLFLSPKTIEKHRQNVLRKFSSKGETSGTGVILVVRECLKRQWLTLEQFLNG